MKNTDKNTVEHLRKTDDDGALLILYSEQQGSLQASAISALVGKKRKETTACNKQFFEANILECISGLALQCSH